MCTQSSPGVLGSQCPWEQPLADDKRELADTYPPQHLYPYSGTNLRQVPHHAPRSPQRCSTPVAHSHTPLINIPHTGSLPSLPHLCPFSYQCFLGFPTQQNSLYRVCFGTNGILARVSWHNVGPECLVVLRVLFKGHSRRITHELLVQDI